MSVEHSWNDNDGEKQSTHRKTQLSTTLATTNPIWIGLGFNLEFQSDRPELTTSAMARPLTLNSLLQRSDLCIRAYVTEKLLLTHPPFKYTHMLHKTSAILEL